MPRGEFKLIIGNMFGNKTGRLMLKVETLRQFGRKRILIFKPDIDTRSDSGYIKDYHGKIVLKCRSAARKPTSPAATIATSFPAAPSRRSEARRKPK